MRIVMIVEAAAMDIAEPALVAAGVIACVSNMETVALISVHTVPVKILQGVEEFLAAQILQHVIMIQMQLQMMDHVIIQKPITTVLGTVMLLMTVMVNVVDLRRLITVVCVIFYLPMTVCKTAQVPGVDLLQMMIAEFAMVTTHHVQIVQEFPMAQTGKVIAAV